MALLWKVAPYREVFTVNVLVLVKVLDKARYAAPDIGPDPDAVVCTVPSGNVMDSCICNVEMYASLTFSIDSTGRVVFVYPTEVGPTVLAEE